MVKEEDWGPVARILVARGVMEVTNGDDIPRWKGGTDGKWTLRSPQEVEEERR